MSDARRPVLSVVVIGRNEEERLRGCLVSAVKMRGFAGRSELIYVDSGSVDGSVDLAASLGARTIALQPRRPTAAMARNAGWRAAAGEFVLFLDGDTVVDQQFAAHSLQEFVDQGTGVVWGHRREMYPERSVFHRVLDLDWMYAPGETQFCGGDALFRRDVLCATGGFDETLIAGEEPELCRRIVREGYRILHVDREMTKHDLGITTARQYWMRAMRAGHAYAEVAKRFAGNEDAFWAEENRRNSVRVAFLSVGIAVAVGLSVVSKKVWPAAGVAAGFVLLAGRTAWRARWKSSNVWTLLLYAVHSHVQHVPIFAGRIWFWRSERTGRATKLVEYKLP